MNNFLKLKALYDKDQFSDLIAENKGIRFLKIRSISRSNLIRSFAKQLGKDTTKKATELFKEIFDDNNISENKIEKFINSIYSQNRKKRLTVEDKIYSQLYKLNVFNWGGFYQNAVEKNIVNNYIKKIWQYDKLVDAVETDITPRLTNYVTASWYNHWSSVLIEDIFTDHKSILPSVGLIKKVDFFWNNFPFDLKVTYFPDGFLQKERKERKLKPELSELKYFARKNQIPYDNKQKNNEIFKDLLIKIEEDTSLNSKKFMKSFTNTRKKILKETIKHPSTLIKWLYEEQGERRFDASNRLFLVLVDKDNFEESWKLKRNKKLLYQEINNFLNSSKNLKPEEIKLKFSWKNEVYTTYSKLHFIVK